jgi:hypothetical protein
MTLTQTLLNQYLKVAQASLAETPAQLAKEMVQSLVEPNLRNIFISVEYLVKNGHIELECWLQALNLTNDNGFWRQYCAQLEERSKTQLAPSLESDSSNPIPLTEQIKQALSVQYTALNDLCDLMPESIQRTQVMSALNRLIKNGTVERQTSFGSDIEPNFRLCSAMPAEAAD